MYTHDWCRTTSQINGKTYICLKCAACTSLRNEEENCLFSSRSKASKFKHNWGIDNVCTKCKAKKCNVSHAFYKVGNYQKPYSRIEPCQYTDNDWVVKDIIE